MRPRHPPVPTMWLITDARLGPDLLRQVRRLPRGAGVLVRHHDLPPRQRRQLLRTLQRIAAARRLQLVDDVTGAAARVHSARELRAAVVRTPQLLFISPLFPTRTHLEWQPLGRMRAAALARLAARPVLALGGMNSRRFARIKALGFAGWGGIDAFSGGTTPT